MNHFLYITSWLVPFYGLIGAILTLPWAMGIIRQTGPRPAAYLNLLTTLLAFAHSLLVFKDILDQEPESLLIHWFKAADLDLSFALEISPVSVGATVLITGLSLLAQIYALGLFGKRLGIGAFFCADWIF